MQWLRNLRDVPPQEFWYRQTEGIQKVFEGSPLIGDTASRVASFRKGNNLPCSSERECLRDVIEFTVARLGKSEWVYDTDSPAESLLPSNPISGCGSCGAKL